MNDVTLRRVRFNYFCCGKAISIKYYACVRESFVTQHANSMNGIILSYVVCPALLLFSTLSHKWHDSGKHKIRILIFSTNFV